MKLQGRLEKLEAAMGLRPAPDAAATFAEPAEALDRLAARKAGGDVAATAELDALAAFGRGAT